jgi:hypothetical protein
MTKEQYIKLIADLVSGERSVFTAVEKLTIVKYLTLLVKNYSSDEEES